MSKEKKNIKKKKLRGTQMMIRQLPFFYFLCALALVYIANAHYAEKKVRKIEQMKSGIEELRWEFNSVKSDFLYKSTKSQLAQEIRNIGLGETADAPKKIEIKDSKQ